MARQHSNRKLAWKLAGWLLSELLLSAVGLDDLADYGEFLAHQQLALVGPEIQMMQAR